LPVQTVYSEGAPMSADLIYAVCDPTPASRRAIRLWHPCVDG
jgi:hypothetical protein